MRKRADMDYVDKLNIEDKEWLEKFNNEYYDLKGLKELDALHNTPELKKNVYDMHNAARRDIVHNVKHKANPKRRPDYGPGEYVWAEKKSTL